MKTIHVLVATASAILLLIGCAAVAELQADNETASKAPAARVSDSTQADPLTEEEVKAAYKAALERAKAEGKSRVAIKLGEDPDIVQGGDLVEVRFTARLENGEFIHRPEKNEETVADETPVTESVRAGHMASLPGLGEAVIGMTRGETKTVTVVAEKAFGPRDPEKVETYPRVKRVPRVMKVPVDALEKRAGKLPPQGQSFRMAPYFMSRLVTRDADYAVIEHLAEDGAVQEDPFGKTTVRLEGDDVVIALEPVAGAPFESGKRLGFISAVDFERFKVDYNHPLAGKELIFDIEVLDYRKESRLYEIDIPWLEALDKGYERAADEKRPMLVVLYADWCQWSQKLLKVALEDPRVKQYAEDFVWVKIDSDQDKGVYSYFKQDGYPMIVLLSPEGETLERIEGYQDPRLLSQRIKAVLAGEHEKVKDATGSNG